MIRLLSRVLLTLLLLLSANVIGHPLKLSASLLEYRSDRGKLYFECKVFCDDFQLSLGRVDNRDVPLTYLTDADVEAVEIYFNRYVSLRHNGQELTLKYHSSEVHQAYDVWLVRFEEIPLQLVDGDVLEVSNELMFKDFGLAQANRVTIRMEPYFKSDSHAFDSVVHSVRYKF